MTDPPDGRGARRWRLRTRLTLAVVATVAVASLLGGATYGVLGAAERSDPAATGAVVQRGGEDAYELLARRRLLLAVTAAVVSSTIVGWWLVGRALRPLDGLVATADELVATADLRTRFAADGPDEVASVATTLNRLLARLEQAEAATAAALESSRSFAAGAAHELRTPLTSMQADLDVLDNPALGDGERADVLAQVRREQARLVALLDQLLHLARGDLGLGGTVERVELADVVAVAVDAARRRYPEADLHAQLGGPPDPVVVGSGEGLRLVVDNLLDNAVRHGARTVGVTLAPVPGAVTLTVDDDGPGIPVADRPRVLGRFERGAAPSGPGSGLGLALVAQQVQLHGGTITLLDGPLGGLRVQVVLPSS